MKKLLKVGDKNKLGERRKLIIHNRQFTWMSMTEAAKLKLLPLKKEKSHFQVATFLLCHSAGQINLATSVGRDATRNLFLRKVKTLKNIH